MHDFIEIYDDHYIHATCDEIIKFFDQVYIPKPSGLKTFNRNRQKVCSTLTCNFGEDWKINDLVYKFVTVGIEKYRENLLDISNRNNLINLSFNPRSNKVLRIIDELPNTISKKLFEEEKQRQQSVIVSFAVLETPLAVNSLS